MRLIYRLRIGCASALGLCISYLTHSARRRCPASSLDRLSGGSGEGRYKKSSLCLRLYFAGFMSCALPFLNSSLPLDAQVYAAPQEVMTFSGDDVRAHVYRVVERSPLLKNLEVAEIKPPRFSSQRAPQGSKLTVSVVGELRGGRVPVEVSLSYQGRLLRKLRSFVEVDFFMTGWALKSTKTAGTSLSRSDLVEVRRPSRVFSRDAIQDHTQIVGAKLRRSVGAKVPLRRAWLMIPPLVKRGAIVELIFSRKSISLSAQGEALGDGKKSDMIRVRNLNSKKIVTGRVIGINRVDVGRR